MSSSARGQGRVAASARGARCRLLLALLAVPALPAQDSRDEALRAFTDVFLQAIAKSKSGRPSACVQAMALFETAAELVPALPEASQEQARFGIAVRQAQVRQRGGKTQEAVAQIDAVRARWGGDPSVWKGAHRVLALVVLWCCVRLETFLAKVDSSDQAFLLSDGVTPYRDDFVGTLPLLQADLLLVDPKTEPRGIELLQKTWEDLRARSAGGDPDGLGPWRVHCARRLFAYYFARREYERASAWLAELPAAETHQPRSKLALELEDYDLAAAEANLAALGADGRPPDKTFWAQVGDALEMQGKYAQALEAYDQCLAAAKDPLDLAAARDGRGDALLGLGKAAEAKACYDQVEQSLLGLGFLGPRASSELAECRKDKGRVAELAGDRVGALGEYQRALSAIEDARAQLPMDVLGDAFLGDDALLALDGILRLGPGDANGAWSGVAAIEGWRARGLLDRIEAPPRGAAWERLRQRVKAVMISGGAEAGAERLRDLERERTSLGASSRPSARGLFEDDLRRLAASDPATVFVVTWLDHERGARKAQGRARLFLLHGKEASAFDLGTRGRADRLARQALAAVADPGADPWPALREAAGFWLPAPVRARLSGAARVVLCLDQGHAQLPFEAFPLADARPVGLALPVERAPSLAIWRRLGTRHAQGEVRVIVDSVEDDGTTKGLGLPRLAFSSREADAVAREIGPAKRVAGRDATLPAIRAALGGGGIELLHLSAHATAHPSVPTAASLLLADGPAPFATLADLPLSGSLVVLSACTSAGAEARGGEGVIGLSWGPLAAGARGVVAAIYEVNQQATADLMAVFHHERAGGAGAAEALRAARARLAESPNYAHPHYWAGFVAITNDRLASRAFAVGELPLWGAAACALIASLLWMEQRRRSLRRER